MSDFPQNRSMAAFDRYLTDKKYSGVLAAGAIPEETSDSDDDDWSTRYDKDPGDAADEPTEEELWQQEFEEEWEERWSDY